MAQTYADDDLKSKSLQAEFAYVNSVGDKRSFGRDFCITVKRLRRIKELLNALLQRRYEATYEGKFIDGIVLR